MSRNIKLLLIGVGLMAASALCGGTTYAIYDYFQSRTPLTSPTETPAVVLENDSDGLVISEDSANQPVEELPFRSVVQISALIDDGGELIELWTGSGSIISPDGLILTNAHVVLPDIENPIDFLMVSLTGNPDELPTPGYFAEVVQADVGLDLAVIRITTDLNGNEVDFYTLDLPAVPLGNSDQLSLGDELIILGYPGIGGETITLTSGKVSGFTGESGYGNRAFIKTNATIAGGNSGGLAVNTAGELVGIPTQLGYGGEEGVVDCRILADTNGDGVTDENDNCIPTGGFINSLRPVNLAIPYIDKARSGESAFPNHFTGEESQPPDEEPVEETGQGEIIYKDDFSDTDSGWQVFGDEEGGAGYVDETYQIEVITPQLVRWGVSGNSFDDVAMNVEVDFLNPSGDGDFGFVCRYVDQMNFYALEIREDGYASIWKLSDGDVAILVEWTDIGSLPSSSIDLGASCIGDELRLYLAGEAIASAADADFPMGDIGFIAGTNNGGNLLIAFDNLEVTVP